jgi:formamidopyrimidine-DNA glycosylase
MPELPEVETVVRRLRSSVVNQKIQKVRIVTPKIVRPPAGPFIKSLQGAIIRKISRKGKFILITLDPAGTLILHLKMTGQVLLETTATPGDQHTHLILSFYSSPIHMHYRDIRKFGFFDFLSGGAVGEPLYLKKIGPDPLEISPKTFFERIRHKKRSIKSVLLDQSVISGLGNIYVDESLFLSGVHPQIKASTLSPDQARTLFRIIKKILNRAIDLQGSTLRNFRTPDGNSGGYQKFHQVYRRKGQSCPRCGSSIAKMIVAGRGTHYCPSCQRTG